MNHVNQLEFNCEEGEKSISNVIFVPLLVISLDSIQLFKKLIKLTKNENLKRFGYGLNIKKLLIKVKLLKFRYSLQKLTTKCCFLFLCHCFL